MNEIKNQDIFINLSSGVSFRAPQVPDETYLKLLGLLQNPEVKEFTFNNQWFNKENIATVYRQDDVKIEQPEISTNEV